MSQTTITLEIPESLYRTASQVAKATKRPIEEIVRESLTHMLPPLDDVPTDQAEELALLSSLDNTALRQKAEQQLPAAQQEEMDLLLDRQNSGELSAVDTNRLQLLLDEYGRLLVHKSHAWLLLARRGYQVPPIFNILLA